MRTNKQTTGDYGEKLAMWWLKKQGFSIEFRRFRTAVGEIDVIARKKNALYFLEIKTRKGDRFGKIGELVSPQKWEAKTEVVYAFIEKNQEKFGECDCVMGLLGVEIKNKKTVFNLFLLD